MVKRRARKQPPPPPCDHVYVRGCCAGVEGSEGGEGGEGGSDEDLEEGVLPRVREGVFRPGGCFSSGGSWPASHRSVRSIRAAYCVARVRSPPEIGGIGRGRRGWPGWLSAGDLGEQGRVGEQGGASAQESGSMQHAGRQLAGKARKAAQSSQSWQRRRAKHRVTQGSRFVPLTLLCGWLCAMLRTLRTPPLSRS